jgi:hypothetical protein
MGQKFSREAKRQEKGRYKFSLTHRQEQHLVYLRVLFLGSYKKKVGYTRQRNS